MKKLITIALLFLATAGFSQIANVVIMGDTTVGNSKFSYKFAGELHISVVDSMLNDTTPVPGYIPLLNSRAEIIYRKTRIVDGSTIVIDEGTSVPLSEIATKYSTLINSNEFKKAFKKGIKAYSLKKKLTE